MWGDVQIADPRVVGQHDGERRWRTTGPELLIEHVRDGGRADRPSPECLGERGIESGRAEAVGQIEQAARCAEERMAPRGEGVDEAGGVGAQTAEPIASAQLVRVTKSRPGHSAYACSRKSAESTVPNRAAKSARTRRASFS